MHNTGKGPCSPCGGKCKYAKGGDVKEETPIAEEPMEASEDSGEEMPEDHELHDQCAGELMSALESKDKKGVLDAIKAIVLSMGDK